MERKDHVREQFEALVQQRHVRGAQTRTGERRWSWWRHTWRAPALVVLGLALGSVTLSHADVIQCGAVLGPGGRFVLESDLDCPRGVAVTLRDGAILDLNGYHLTCNLLCVLFTGEEAQLWNGTVAGGFHYHIVLEGTGGHTMRDVTSSIIEGNIRVLSDNNRLINVTTHSLFSPHFIIEGNNNRLTDSTAFCRNLVFGNDCIFVLGDENHVDDTVVAATGSGFGSSGIGIMGNNNRLSGNQVSNPPAGGGPTGGIVVTGTGNDIRDNIAVDTTLDLQDTNGNCAHNTWKHNVFKTSDPACIE